MINAIVASQFENIQPSALAYVFDDDQYQLIDFGHGRKLERFGSCVLDRPCPAAEPTPCMRPEQWTIATARYERHSGTGHRPRKSDGYWSGQVGPSWVVRRGPLTLELRLTPFGHVGLFPEHAANWDWLAQQLARFRQPPRVLNLFAYTGASTLAAAKAGAQVTHVDAARNVVLWARQNAAHSGLAAAPIRWIAEDARQYVRRELRRGNRYQGIVLDPPSYGHGPKGQAWRIDHDLAPLLRDCVRLLDGPRQFLLLTCHSTGYGTADVQAALSDALSDAAHTGITADSMALIATDGRRLPAGVVARWSCDGCDDDSK